jgi:hypothetical protein
VRVFFPHTNTPHSFIPRIIGRPARAACTHASCGTPHEQARAPALFNSESSSPFASLLLCFFATKSQSLTHPLSPHGFSQPFPKQPRRAPHFFNSDPSQCPQCSLWRSSIFFP